MIRFIRPKRSAKAFGGYVSILATKIEDKFK